MRTIPILSINFDYIPNQPEYKKVPFIELKWPPEQFTVNFGDVVRLATKERLGSFTVVKKLIVEEVIGTRIIFSIYTEPKVLSHQSNHQRVGYGIPRHPNWGPGSTGYYLVY